MSNFYRLSAAGALAASLLLAGCAANDPYQRTKTGAAIGAVAGGVLGHQLDDDAGRYVGAAVGALAGGALGNYMDRQEAAFEQTLAADQDRYNLEIQRLQNNTLKVNIPSEVSFDYDSATLKPGFYSTLDKVAGLLNEYRDSTVTIVGHTDSRGSDSYNLDLSRRRAESVAQYLTSRGVDYGRLRTEGAGESQPRASNDNEAGRQQNRRVELLIQTTGAVAQAPAQPQPYPQQQGSYPPPQQGGGYYDPRYPQQQSAYPPPQQGGYYDPRYPQGGNPSNPQGLPY